MAGGINLYTYVANNPISKIDPSGLEGFDPGPTPPGADVPMQPPYRRPPNIPSLPPHLANRSKNCKPYYRVSGKEIRNGQTLIWEGLLPLVNEKEEPVSGSECKVKVTCYYNGTIRAGMDWSTEAGSADSIDIQWFGGKKIEIIKEKGN